VGTLLAAVLLLAWPGSWPAAASVSTLIVPGEALGPARLGMSLAELIAVLGSSVPEADGQVRFPLWAVTAAFQNGLAVRLTTTNPLFRTRRGAGVGTDLSQATHLIGDLNFVSTAYGRGTTFLYPFQGIGFVFRPASAAEVFVVERIALFPRPSPTAAVLTTPQARETGRPAAQSTALMIEGLAEKVDASTGLFRVTGRIKNTGSLPTTSVIVTATFSRITGDDSQKQRVLQEPLGPGAEVPFSFQTFVGIAPVASYTVAVTRVPGSMSPAAQETRTVPPAAYAEIARQYMQVRVDLGAPAANVRGMVQAFVSLVSIGPIPQSWVKDVTVEIPHAGGVGEVHLAPGQVQAILVPQLPVAGRIILGPPAVVGEQPLALVASVVGQPHVAKVTLGAP